MGLLDAPLLDIAYKAISTFGGSCVIRKENRAGYDALTGDSERVADEEYPAPCTPEQAFSKRSFQKALPDNIAVSAGDFVITVPAKNLPIVPAIHMSVKRNGRWFRIIAIDPVNTGDLNVAYTLLCHG